MKPVAAFFVLCLLPVVVVADSLPPEDLRSECLLTPASTHIRACRELAVSVGNDFGTLLKLGRNLENVHRYTAAVTVYDQALAYFPGNGKLLRRKALSISDLEEARRTQNAVATRNSTVAVRTKVEEIKCKYLQAVCSDTVKTDSPHSDVYRRSSEPETSSAARPRITQVAKKIEVLGQLFKDELISKQEFEQHKHALLASAIATPAVAQTGGEVVVAAHSNGSYLDLDSGKFHALVIGNDEYNELPQLETAVNDARAVAQELRNNYGFSVKTLLNVSRYEIVRELSHLRSTLTEKDNLMIYYAGHGYLDEVTSRGYWLPVDAEEDNFANWVSTTDVTDALNGMQARHVLVVADSCYSGALVREAGNLTTAERGALLKRLSSKRSRTVLSSGGLEPVLDSGGGNHSVFTSAFLNALRSNRDVLEAGRMFTQLRQQVVLEADQTPEYAEIRKAGHEGGDFLFIRQDRVLARKAPQRDTNVSLSNVAPATAK